MKMIRSLIDIELDNAVVPVFSKKIFFFHSLALCLEVTKTTPEFDDSQAALTGLSILSHF